MFKPTLRTLLIIVCVASLAACGGSSKGKKQTSTTKHRAKVAAKADIALVGDKGLAGKLTSPRVICSLPTLYGRAVVVLGQSSDKSASVRISVGTGHVNVSVSSGAGRQYRGRTFTGTGVSSFTHAKGAQLDSSLKAITQPGVLPGNLGTVTSVKGSISCGSQRPGKSTIVLTGVTADGTIKRRLSPVRVSCLAKSAAIVGVSTLGSRVVLVSVNIAGGAATLTTQTATSTSRVVQRQYKMPTGTVVYAKKKIHFNGNATEAVLAGARAHTIHVVGDATCGT